MFHNSNMFGSCIIHIYIQGVLKLKKNNSGAKRLKGTELRRYSAVGIVARYPLDSQVVSLVLYPKLSVLFIHPHAYQNY
jgi:hypothetical protein